MRERKFHMRKLPLASWLMILVALGSLGTGTVAAYLSYATSPVTNSFTPDQAETPVLVDTTEGTSVTGIAVSVGDTGYTVYVRAAVVVNWEKGTENNQTKPETVYHAPPVAGKDYTLPINTEAWFEHDGFYYHKAPVASNGTTAQLLKQPTSQSNNPEGTDDSYFKEIEIMVQTIQALGTTDAGNTPAVTDAWGVYVDSSGELTATPPTT